MAILLRSRQQIAKMREAGRLVADTFELLRPHVRPGVSTRELDQIAEKYIRSRGATPVYKGYNGFPATICVAVNNVICHGFPSKTPLRQGDIVGIDIGARLNGWVGDSCVTYPVGSISPAAGKLMQVAEESMWRGIRAAQAGGRLGDVGAAIQAYVEENGCSIVREWTGHGVGEKLHEDPSVPHFGKPGSGILLRPGFIFTVEPMVNAGSYETVLDKRDGWTVRTADGSLSAQFEHTIVITDNGPEILTLPGLYQERVMSISADEYLAAALAIIEQHAMYRDRIDWPTLRLTAAQHAAGASTPADTYDTIRWVLTQLQDRHSFFAPPDRGDIAIASGAYEQEATVPDGHLRTDGIAYLYIPAFRGSPQRATRYADALQAQIAQLDSADPVGWMVDLTENSGGNMWPMLAGLGPLLGEGPLGSFDFPNQPPAIWSYRAGQAWFNDSSLAQVSNGGYHLRTTAPPVALLITTRTASSGEAVLIAFCGRPNTCRFGTTTRGLTTANEGFPLPDDATVAVTVATFVDRFGQVYGDALAPDQYVDGDADQIQTCAAKWIHATAQSGASQP